MLQVHPPTSQVYSGVPTMMMIDLRDACGALTTKPPGMFGVEIYCN